MQSNPKYDVMSARFTSEEKAEVSAMIEKQHKLQSEFVREAVLEKLARERNPS